MRQREQEDRKAQAEVDAEAEADNKKRQDAKKQEQWLLSAERLEKELEERVRRSSLLLQAKISRGKAGRIDMEEGAGEGAEALGRLQRVEQPSSERAEEEQASVQPSPSEPSGDGEAEAEDAESASSFPAETKTPSGDSTSESSQLPSSPPFTAAVDGKGEESRVAPAPADPEAVQRANFAARMQLSIKKDRERMEAEQDKARLRLQKEKARLLSFEERKAAEEADRLERKVKRLLRKEQAIARAKAKQEEVDGLLSAAVDEAAKARELASARKKTVVDSAREARKSVAVREVSLLMMDKEWGVKHSAAEERQVMLNYLQYVDEEEDVDEWQEQAKEDTKVKRSRSKTKPTRTASTASSSSPSPLIGPVVQLPVAPNAEEWEDDAERVLALPQLKPPLPPVIEGVDGRRRAEDSNESQDDSDSDIQSDASEADVRLDAPFSPTASAGQHAQQLLNRPEGTQQLLDDSRDGDVRVEEAGAEDEGEDTAQPPSHVRRGSRRTSVKELPQRRLSSGGLGRRSVSRKERPPSSTASVAADEPRPRTVRKRAKPHVSFQEEKEEKERTTAHGPRSSHRPAMQNARRVEEQQRDPVEEEEQYPQYEDEEEEEEEDERDSELEEEKETLTTALEAEERQRLRDKKAALRSQQRRANREEAGSVAMLGRVSAAARVLHPLPSLAASPPASSSSIPSFTSFPPLSLPHLAGTLSFSSVPLDSLWPSFEAAQSSAFHSRPLLAAKSAGGGGGSAAADALYGAPDVKGSDWRAAEDEEALASILRRVIPRSRQAELERARRAIMTKAKMR